MRNLVYIANARIPTEKAHGIQIMQMCQSFGELEMGGEKLEVELVLPRRLNPIKQDPFEYYGVKKNFKITKLPTLDFIAFGWGFFGFFLETFVFLIASRIYLLFRSCDILYTRELMAGLFFKNVMLEIHSLPASEARLQNFCLPKILKNARALLVLTSFIKNEIVKWSISENKILVLPDAVDLEKFDIRISKEDARKKLNLPQDKKLAVYTGQLFDWKGAETLVRAGEILKSRNVEIYIVGGGGPPKARALQDLAQSSGTSRAIRQHASMRVLAKSGAEAAADLLFVGQKPHSEIPLWLKAADVLVLPNTGKQKISRYYTSPMKMFEYMASGRPIVASDLPSLREILTENETVFFLPGDPQDLASAIKEILANPPLADRLSQNALKKVQNHTWSARSKHAIDFITSLAG